MKTLKKWLCSVGLNLWKEWAFSGIVILLCGAAAFMYVMDPKTHEKQDQTFPPPLSLVAGKPVSDPAPEGIGNAKTRAIPTSQTSTIDGQKAATDKATVSSTSKETADTQEKDNTRTWFRILLVGAAGFSLIWFAFAFTGDAKARRCEGVKFAYFFVIASFAVLAIPPFVKSQAIGNEPIGIVSGCVKDAKASDQLRCTSSTEKGVIDSGPQKKTTSDSASKKEEKNQWLINIGGALEPQSNDAKDNSGVKCSNKKPEPECKIGSMNNRTHITGGLVVPLPFVIIALFGGAISLSRRVPEIQKCSEPDYAGTATDPVLSPSEARERLAFQIMQYISAPLIAVVAYQAIQPETEAAAAALAFMSGFGSETILLMIRGVVNGIQPRTLISAPPTGAVVGVVTEAGKPVADVEVSIAESSIKTKTDKDGRYIINSVPVGPQKITALKDHRSVSVAVSIVLGQTVTCDIPLPGADPVGSNPSSGNQSGVTAASKAAPSSVAIRLVIDGNETLDAGSLSLTLDGSRVDAPADGLIELPLEVERPHRIVATGRRAGKEVRGELPLTPTLDDEDKAFSLELL